MLLDIKMIPVSFSQLYRVWFGKKKVLLGIMRQKVTNVSVMLVYHNYNSYNIHLLHLLVYWWLFHRYCKHIIYLYQSTWTFSFPRVCRKHYESHWRRTNSWHASTKVFRRPSWRPNKRRCPHWARKTTHINLFIIAHRYGLYNLLWCLLSPPSLFNYVLWLLLSYLMFCLSSALESSSLHGQ